MMITMYELLGMIKDGKAPKRIKYGNVIYKKMNIDNYEAENFNIKLFDYNFFQESRLNDEVEILEEEKKFTKEDFIKERMQLDGITREQFDEKYEVKECNCGMPFCKGFIAKEKKEKKIPEKLETVDFEKNYEYRINCEQSFQDIVIKINEIIDYLDYLKSKGDE